MQPRRRARETEGGQQEERRRRKQRQDGAGDAKPGGTQPEAKPENAHGGSMPCLRSCGSRRPQPDANKNPGGSLRRGSEIRNTGRVGLLAGLVGILLGPAHGGTQDVAERGTRFGGAILLNRLSEMG